MKTIRLLVTLNGAEGSAEVRTLRLGSRVVQCSSSDHARLPGICICGGYIDEGDVLVSGRSMGDVIKCIEAAALESQGPTDHEEH